MSYDIGIYVKVDGWGEFVQIAEPEYASPTYNLGQMFRACMDWDYSQSEKDENGEWHTCYYPCDFVIERVEHGIKELTFSRKSYEIFNPPNGWGNIDSAINSLKSLRDCIYEQAEEIPIKCLYMAW